MDFPCKFLLGRVISGKKGHHEVLVQGGVIDDLAKHLVDHYSIPKRHIEVLDKTRKWYVEDRAACISSVSFLLDYKTCFWMIMLMFPSWNEDAFSEFSKLYHICIRYWDYLLLRERWRVVKFLMALFAWTSYGYLYPFFSLFFLVCIDNRSCGLILPFTPAFTLYRCL